MEKKLLNSISWLGTKRIRSSLVLIGLCFMSLPCLHAASESCANSLIVIQVSGIVTSETNETMPGVNIVEKGTVNGTTSDVNGKFTLQVKDESSVLVFSFIGFKTQEILVGSQTQISIALLPDAQTLSEVVVTGYSTQSKRDITGAVSSVDGKALTSVPATSFAQQLQGRAAGVQVGNDNSPGGGVAIRIRGVGSITGGNDPLYVIDGVPTQGGLNQLNPNDIEDIQILKDASAASIYGSRANNGVIIVTTKKGKNGEARIDFDSYYGVQNSRGNEPGFLKPQQFADIYWQAARNSGQVDPVTGNPVSSVFGSGANPVVPDYVIPVGAFEGDPYTTIDNYSNNPLDPAYGLTKFQVTKVNRDGTNWYDELLQSAPIQSYNLSASAANEKGRYAISGSYFDQEGIAKFTGFKRYTLRVNTEFNIKKHIRVGENFQYGFTDDVSTTVRSSSSPFVQFMLIPSLIPVFDIAGNYSGNRDKTTFTGDNNPYGVLHKNKDNHNYTSRAFGNLYLEFDFLKNFTARTSVGVDYLSRTSSVFTPYPYENYLAQPQAATLEVFNNSNLGLTWTNTLKYAATFSEKHNLTVLAGTEAVTLDAKNFATSKQGFAFEDIDYQYLDAGSTVISASGSGSASSLFSLFAKADYSFDDRFILSATIRRDASSRFAKAYRWGTFPAFSAGWRVSQENFMKQVSLISDLKLRAGWGKTGNQEIDPYNQYSTYATSIGTSAYDVSGSSNSVQAGFEQRKIGNPNARWEAQTMSNIGLDISLLQNKFDLTVDVYKRTVDDLLLVIPILATDGQNQKSAENIGSMYNKGVDISLAYHGAVLDDELKFTITGNWSTYKNEVTKLYAGEDAFITGYRTQRLTSMTRTQVGHAISSFYGYQIEGILQTQGEADAHATQGGSRDLFNTPGRFKFADLNGDGQINSEDQTFIGSPIPDFSYGINLEVSYKNFDLGVFLQGVQGNEIFNYSRYGTDFFTGTNWGVRMLDSWTPENPNGTLPELNLNTGGFESQASTHYVEDGSYFRGRSIQLGYSIPKASLAKLSIERVRVYAQALNFFTSTNYSGIDPEVNLSYFGNGADRDIGVDRGIYPSAKSFIFGLQIGL